MNWRFSSSSAEARDRQIGLGKMVAPFLVELHQALKLRLEVIHRLGAALFGGGIEVQVRGRFARISR